MASDRDDLLCLSSLPTSLESGSEHPSSLIRWNCRAPCALPVRTLTTAHDSAQCMPATAPCCQEPSESSRFSSRCLGRGWKDGNWAIFKPNISRKHPVLQPLLEKQHAQLRPERESSCFDSFQNKNGQWPPTVCLLKPAFLRLPSEHPLQPGVAPSITSHCLSRTSGQLSALLGFPITREVFLGAWPLPSSLSPHTL